MKVNFNLVFRSIKNVAKWYINKTSKNSYMMCSTGYYPINIVK